MAHGALNRIQIEKYMMHWNSLLSFFFRSSTNLHFLSSTDVSLKLMSCGTSNRFVCGYWIPCL